MKYEKYKLMLVGGLFLLLISVPSSLIFMFEYNKTQNSIPIIVAVIMAVIGVALGMGLLIIGCMNVGQRNLGGERT